MDERQRRFAARRPDVEVDRDEKPARSQIRQVVSYHGDRIGDVEEYQPADDGIERLGIPPGGGIALDEGHPGVAGRRGALPCLDQHVRRSVEADDRPSRADHRRYQTSDMAKSGAEVEHPPARLHAGGAQQQARGRLDCPRLGVEPRQLLRVAAEHVALRL